MQRYISSFRDHIPPLTSSKPPLEDRRDNEDLHDDEDHHDDDNDLFLTLLERKQRNRRTDRRLPLRYRDLLPEPQHIAPPFPVSPLASTVPAASLPVSQDIEGDDTNPISIGTQTTKQRVSHVFRTLCNTFNLFRQYNSLSAPLHDPEANATGEDLSDVMDQPQSLPAEPPSPSYSPYPNRNAFLLGEWYWNGGAQKSQSSFKDLLDIVSDPTFSPSDVRNIKWNDVDKQLTQDDWAEEEDTGWTRTPVTILVPAQHRCNSSSQLSPQDFIVADFFHQSIVSVVQEALSSPARHRNFHYEPYELKWQSPGSPDPISVHGELYTSPAFIKAHLDLQNSPPEPNCNLPRCIVALMDATHFTSFGDVKLWPLYLYFGNESKYHRCKPSKNLCCHIAYFQGVRILPLSKPFIAD
jgi:hypothetical protein